MKIADLKSGQGKVDITVTVKDMEEPRVIDKFGKQIKVANATAVDDSGEIKLTLWNDDINNIKVGSIVKITNGYVNEFKGELQLTSGKFGKIEIVEKKGDKDDDDNEELEEEISDEEGIDY